MIPKISEVFKNRHEEIEKFFQQKCKNLKPLLYISCDIRHSGHKVAVIDTNLFPAGFNNLCNSFSRHVSDSFKKYLSQYYPDAKKILLLIEEHTRNRYYLENIFHLKTLLEKAGLEIRAGYLGQEITEEKIDLELDAGKKLLLEKINFDASSIGTPNFQADLVISNNDFTQGLPENLKSFTDKIIPSPLLGWHQRRKSDHFAKLQTLVEEFAQAFNLDPWLLNAHFEKAENIDITSPSDLNQLAETVGLVLDRTKNRYKEYGIDEEPYVFIKSDSGTYGMGLLNVSQPEDVLQMNRRERNKLLSGKGGIKSTSFLVQEGVPTVDFYSEFPIEPVIYAIGFEPVGGFFRMNPERDAQSSLNSRGMIFSCLCLHKLDEPHEANFLRCEEKQNLVCLSYTMAQLAAIAAAQEWQAVASKNLG